MIKIQFPQNAGDLRVIRNIIRTYCAHETDPKIPNDSPEGIYVYPLFGNLVAQGDPTNNWMVVDNRDHQCFEEEFDTLDGALAYATDLQITCEKQALWDIEGEFRPQMIKQLKRGKEKNGMQDPLASWDSVGDDCDDLVERFAKSIIDNVNGKHTVEFITEDHDNGDGTYEAEPLIRVTFTNCVGSMVEVDNALEQINGRDWRMIADEICKRLLQKQHRDPEKFDWPTPDVRVTHDYYEDENDITKTVTLVWQVDEETWKACQSPLAEAAELPKQPAVVHEYCPNCEYDNTIEWDVEKEGYVAYCPHCGAMVMLCDECMHADDNPNHDCNAKLCAKRKATACCEFREDRHDPTPECSVCANLKMKRTNKNGDNEK